VIVVMIVIVIVIVLRRGAGLGDDFDPTVSDATSGEDPVGDRLELVRPAAHHDDLEAQIVAQVNV
jgi:hypothetical protein